jgi:hypothetical protein
VQDGATSARAVRGWPLKADAPPGFAGFYSEHREWLCATGACSPFHADLSAKPPLQTLAASVEFPAPQATPFRPWVSAPSFASTVSMCAPRVHVSAEQVWKIHAEGTTSVACPPGFVLGSCERDGRRLPCRTVAGCTEGISVFRVALSGDASPDTVRCLNDQATHFFTTGTPFTDEIAVHITPMKTPTGLDDMGFRCVRGSRGSPEALSTGAAQMTGLGDASGTNRATTSPINPRSPGRLDITTMPDARISIDGGTVGATPAGWWKATFDVAPGKHVVGLVFTHFAGPGTASIDETPGPPPKHVACDVEIRPGSTTKLAIKTTRQGLVHLVGDDGVPCREVGSQSDNPYD